MPSMLRLMLSCQTLFVPHCVAKESGVTYYRGFLTPSITDQAPTKFAFSLLNITAGILTIGKIVKVRCLSVIR